MTEEKIIIFDTTLRDGEQSPGASLNVDEKIKIAKQLATLGVDVIEAGFPISSPGEFEAVKRIAKNVKGAVICGLARALKNDIKGCWEAIKLSKRPRIHVFLATSEIHMKYKLRKAREEILKTAKEMVKFAKSFTNDVEFSPEDASRTESDFLYEVIETVIDAGATTVNIPDTVGYATPQEFGNLISNIKRNVSNVNKTVISVHCHNDLGLATANSLSAVKNGAGQIECTINGIGERAGNASLEEIAMGLKVRENFWNKTTEINAKEIAKTSKLVSNLAGLLVQPNKAIVGANAFAHSSGIHQDGILKDRRTYEIMKPEDIGIRGHQMVLSARSGRHALSNRLSQLGYNFKDKNFNKIYQRFLNIADKKKEIFNEDLVAIVEEEMKLVPEIFKIKYIHISSGTKTIPTATVIIEKEGKKYQKAASGDGPIDALYKAIDKVTGISGKLKDFYIKSVTSGKDAMGEAVVSVESKGKLITGRGTSTDILEASARAYLNAVNRLIAKRK